MNSEWRDILDEAMERDAETIMDEVNSDPAMKDVQAPPGMYEEIMKMVQEHEREKIYEQLSDEDRECLQIGKAYKKRRKLNRYIVLVAAVVFLLAFGSVSMGEDKNIFKMLSKMLSGREHTIIDTEETDKVSYVHEDELYEKIEKVYGFTPVKLGYLPKDTVFFEATLNQEIQNINMVYETSNKSSLIYIIRPNYRDASFGTDVEDEKVQEYQMRVKNVNIEIKEYIVSNTGENQWSICFVYGDVTYMIRVSNMKQEVIEKIVMNLEFSE